ncbi:hypothetical protein D3C87_1779050 [compost metagenome]
MRRTFILYGLLFKGGTIIAVGIGVQVEINIVQGIRRIVGVLHRYHTIQKMAFIIECDLNFSIYFLLKIAFLLCAQGGETSLGRQQEQESLLHTVIGIMVIQTNVLKSKS